MRLFFLLIDFNAYMTRHDNVIMQLSFRCLNRNHFMKTVLGNLNLCKIRAL